MALTLLFCGSLALGEASCHVMRMLKQRQREAHVVRPLDNIQSKLICYVNEPSWNQVF